MMEKSIFRRFINGVKLFGIAALSMLTLSACHGGGSISEYEIPEEFDDTKPIEIVFWAKNDNNVSQTNIYKKAAEDFHNLYPNVDVTIKFYTDYSRIYNDVITNISTGTTPNICITYPDHIATYMTSENQVLALDDFISDKNFGFGGKKVLFDSPNRNELIDKYLDEGIINGHYYDLPFMRSTEALYVNKAMVEKLGYELPDVLTWDFIWEVSEKAMEKDSNDNFKVNGQKLLIPFIYKSTDNMMIQRLHQIGAGYTTSNGEILLFSDETKPIIYEAAEHGKTRSFSTFAISSYPGNYINAGQCIFAIDSTAGSTWMGPDAPLTDISPDAIDKNIEMVVRPIPQVDVNNISMISQGPSICLFNKEDEQEVLASWLFAQYLLSNEVQIKYAQTEGYVPVTAKAQNDPEYLDYLSRSGEDNNKYYSIKIDVTKLLLDNVDNTFITPVFNGSASVRNAAGQLIETAVKSAKNNKDVNDDYIEYMYTEIGKLYRLDQISISEDGGKRDLGPLPTGAKALIWGVLVVWLCIIAYFVTGTIKERKKHK